MKDTTRERFLTVLNDMLGPISEAEQEEIWTAFVEDCERGFQSCFDDPCDEPRPDASFVAAGATVTSRNIRRAQSVGQQLVASPFGIPRPKSTTLQRVLWDADVPLELYVACIALGLVIGLSFWWWR